MKKLIVALLAGALTLLAQGAQTPREGPKKESPPDAFLKIDRAPHPPQGQAKKDQKKQDSEKQKTEKGKPDAGKH